MTTARLDKTATIEDSAQIAQRRIPIDHIRVFEIGTGVLDQPQVIDGSVNTSLFIYDSPQFGDAIVAQPNLNAKPKGDTNGRTHRSL